MKKHFILAMKWVAPLLTITIAIIQLQSIAFPKWLGINILFATLILYTIAIFIENNDNHPKRKTINIIVTLILSLILLFPIHTHYKDGGSSVYTAMAYEITFWHTIRDDGKADFYGGSTVELFHLFTVYDTSEFDD